MTIRSFSQAELTLLRQCLRAVVEGGFIEAPEFHTRLGVEHRKAQAILSQWPDLDDLDEDSDEYLLINNAFNELCHGLSLTDEEWGIWIKASKAEVKSCLDKWLGKKA